MPDVRCETCQCQAYAGKDNPQCVDVAWSQPVKKDADDGPRQAGYQPAAGVYRCDCSAGPFEFTAKGGDKVRKILECEFSNHPHKKAKEKYTYCDRDKLCFSGLGQIPRSVLFVFAGKVRGGGPYQLG